MKPSSGATALHVAWSWPTGARSIEHLGSAHVEVEFPTLKEAAVERLAAGQTELHLGIAGQLEPCMLPILSSQVTPLWDALCAAYRILGFKSATEGDNVFRDRVLARLIEPTSKIDAERVLNEVGAVSAPYATVGWFLRGFAQLRRRQALAAAEPHTRGAGTRRWCCSTCPRCTSTPMRHTGSAGRDSPNMPPGTADHARAVDRCRRIPADGGGVRGP